MAGGWLTHLATNGAGTIHDWEYAWVGASTEGVEENVAQGTFGTWHETANIHLALMAGALDGLGYGRSLGRFIAEDGATLPDRRRARRARSPPSPRHPLTAGPRRPAPGDDRAGLARRAGSPSSTAGSTPRSSRRRTGTASR